MVRVVTYAGDNTLKNRVQDAIYGPPISVRLGGTEYVRPTVIDMDTVKETARLVGQMLIELPGFPDTVTPAYAVEYSTMPTRPGAVGRTIPLEDLDSITNDERERLAVSITTNAAHHVVLPFQANQPVTWTFPPPHSGNAESMDGFRARVYDKILNSGHPRFNPYRLIAPATYLPILLAIALWLWATLTAPIPLPYYLLGWVALAAGTVLSWRIQRQSVRRHRWEQPLGHRITAVTRADVRTRRADRHSDLKVSAITLVIGIPTALLIAYLTNAFGWRN